MSFQYIKDYYGVPAEMHREVIVSGKRGVITSDKGNYIGVTFYDRKDKSPLPCHPTSEVEYLDSFNPNPPVNKNQKAKDRYDEFLSADWFSGSFGDWLKQKRNTI